MKTTEIMESSHSDVDVPDSTAHSVLTKDVENQTEVTPPSFLDTIYSKLPETSFFNSSIVHFLGVLLCTIIMVISLFCSFLFGLLVNFIFKLPSSFESPASPIFFAILFGIVIRNLFGLHKSFTKGVKFSIKILLKLGIILMGFRLDLLNVLRLGAWSLPIIVSCIVFAFSTTLLVTFKLKESYRLGTLTAIGTAICGATAIVSTAPSISASEDEVAYAVGNITIFGSVSMFLYPYFSRLLFGTNFLMTGLFLGTSIHETAQVAGASMIYDQVFDATDVVDVATITKLSRNLMLILVVPLVSFYYNRKVSSSASSKQFLQLVPFFVFGFLLTATINTIVLHFKWFGGVWEDLTGYFSVTSQYLLAVAMAGVGLSTNLKVFKEHGLKPFIIGIIASLSTTVISILLVFLFGAIL
ncbi:hypothetical protein P9112_012427 [Eukaryota sp. TZLM1-RC]